MTDLRRTLRPDARLVGLHAERGDPPARLAQALADLEGADWGVLLSGEAALAQQLAALVGAGTLRLDHRLRVSREALADAGLAAAGLDGEWRGVRAVWLLEPEAPDFARAQRAGVPVIVDGTLAPGGDWFQGGAQWVVYRDSVTLSGHGDAPLAALFGQGGAPQATAPAPSDLSVALVLRDVATLPLRLARAARTASLLAERLGGQAQSAGPTALYLAPDAAHDTPHGLGGVLAAARHVTGGVLLTPGLDDAETTLGLLVGAGDDAPAPPQAHQAQVSAQPEARDPFPREPRREQPRRERDRGRRDDPRRGERLLERPGERPVERPAERPIERFGERPSRPSQPDVPERVTFEAPHEPREPHEPTGSDTAYPEPLIPPPVSAEETWEPEIVFSDIAQEQVRLPIPVSSGPDAPNLGDQRPDVRRQTTPADPAGAESAESTGVPTPASLPGATDAPLIAPDLPQEGGKEDPASDLSAEQAAVYARLREWRNQEAKRQEISRFIIASNATLAEIARRVPYTEAELRAVKGMGPERMKKYGQKMLEVVRG